jgi:thiol-disulfide isomerase/thioredoxin
MSIEVNPNEVRNESPQWICPSCGAASDKGVGPIAANGAAGTVVCGHCGAKFPETPIDAQLGGPVPPPTAKPSRNPLVLVVVALVVAGMLYFGFHMARRSGSDAAGVFGKNTPAPDFTLEALDGKNMKLSDFRGKAVALNFWATWCGPCKIETPWLVELQKQYADQGLQVVGVAMDDSGKDEIAKFAKDMGMNYPVLLGKEAVGDAYGGVPALPETFFIGRDGKIVDRIIGLRGRSDIEDAIRKALKTQASSRMPDTVPELLQAQK